MHCIVGLVGGYNALSERCLLLMACLASSRLRNMKLWVLGYTVTQNSALLKGTLNCALACLN